MMNLSILRSSAIVIMSLCKSLNMLIAFLIQDSYDLMPAIYLAPAIDLLQE